MDDTACCIETLTHDQARHRIDAVPSIIVPLGGCEPFGGVGALGVETVCALEVARELSRRSGVPVAPAIPFGCSAPFVAFAGTMAVKPRTFVNMLCEIAGGYVFQGIRKIYWVNAAPFNVDPAMEAASRLKVKFPHVEVKLFDINVFGGSEFDRDDAVLLSMFAYLRPDEYMRSKSARPSTHNKRSDEYRTWKKRGRDPQKLRSLFPDGLLSPLNNADIDIGFEIGKGHFERIVSMIQKEAAADFESENR